MTIKGVKETSSQVNVNTTNTWSSLKLFHLKVSTAHSRDLKMLLLASGLFMCNEPSDWEDPLTPAKGQPEEWKKLAKYCQSALYRDGERKHPSWHYYRYMALLKLQILAVWLRTCTLPWQVHATLFAEVSREASFGHSSTVLSAVLSARDSLWHKKLHRQNNPSVVVHPLKMEIWGRETLKSDLLKLYRKSVVGPQFSYSTAYNHMLLLACNSNVSLGTEDFFSMRTAFTDAMWFAFSIIWLNFL